MTGATAPPRAVGGYFELELPRAGALPHPGAHAFQSARAALLALLRERRPRRVWMPRYVCDAMLAPLPASGTAHAFYSLTPQFEVADDIELGEGEWLLHVNYFGLATAAQARTLERFGADRVVCDNAQAFFAAAPECLATIYSARKFFGVADGGLLLARLDAPPGGEPAASGAAHLVARMQARPEDGYAGYLAAEKAFDDLEPRPMSPLSRRLLPTIDLAHVARRRRDNHAFLHAGLGAGNRLGAFAAGDGEAPLCYPYLATRAGLRPALAAQRIFTAGYWPEVAARAAPESFEADLSAHLVAVPCDQRYDRDDLQRVVAAIRELES